MKIASETIIFDYHVIRNKILKRKHMSRNYYCRSPKHKALSPKNKNVEKKLTFKKISF